jgi:hypothetical protein
MSLVSKQGLILQQFQHHNSSNNNDGEKMSSTTVLFSRCPEKQTFRWFPHGKKTHEKKLVERIYKGNARDTWEQCRGAWPVKHSQIPYWRWFISLNWMDGQVYMKLHSNL